MHIFLPKNKQHFWTPQRHKNKLLKKKEQAELGQTQCKIGLAQIKVLFLKMAKRADFGGLHFDKNKSK